MRPSNSQTEELELQKMKVGSFELCCSVCTCAGCTVVCVCVHVLRALWSVCVCVSVYVYMCRVHCGLCAVQETVEAYKKQNQFLSSELLEMNNLRSDDLSINKQQQRSVHINLASLCCNVLLTSVVK